MTETPLEEVSQRIGEIARYVREEDNIDVLRELCGPLVSLMITYWDITPHGSMEMLEVFARELPVSLGHGLVRRVVLGWREKQTYDPTAGGSADHCYLSALILTENYDLAEHPWAEQLLRSTIDKERYYGRTMRDGDRKRALVESLALSGNY
jgi:hypothetical protein